MKRIVFTSTKASAGKTSMILGVAAARPTTSAYMKPFGDRLIYKRKRNWDYDASILMPILGQEDEPERITLGFNHSKLRYIYDEHGVRDSVVRMAEEVGGERELLLVEGGKSLAYGSSVHLDAVSIAKYLKATLVIVASGDNDEVYDDIVFMHRNLALGDVEIGGVIANKVPDVDDFEAAVAPRVSELGINLLGVVPFKEQLTRFSVRFLAERLFAQVIAGEDGLDNVIKHTFVGAMSTEESLRHPVFKKESKFLITSGDRSDMILAALEGDTIGILLTNNLLPPAKIISIASDKQVPLLMVSQDTLQVAKQLEALEALPMVEGKGSINTKEMLARLVKKYVRLEGLT